MTSAALALLGWCLAAPAHAQSPESRWRTVRTEHYVVHYPAVAEAWALDVASQLDSVRERVSSEVGWTPTRRVRVLVLDPYSDANGSAWPFLKRPRMQLWATPPASDSIIGHYRSWTELLVTHEDTHLVHLLRPKRGGLAGILPLGPLALKSPRWIAEGYATLIEARLTGSGRPNSDQRAALLRGLAEEGSLPAYDELNAVDRYMGGSFAYLVGSAFLEWLEARDDGHDLTDLWARMSAREGRSLDVAMEGMWGAPPAELYARFAAELTHAALSIEQPRDTDTLFERLVGTPSSVAVSPDGARVAVIIQEPNQPTTIRVWETGVDLDAVAEQEEAATSRQELDPDDVPDIAPLHPPHRLVAQRAFSTRPPSDVRWFDDGRRLLVSAYIRGPSGRVRADLVEWDVDSGRQRRLTRGADLRAAEPFPGGERAVAVQSRWGTSGIVVVDLETGAIEQWTVPSAADVVSQPRVAPDGTRAAWLEQRGGAWTPVVRDVASGEVHKVELPEGSQVTQLAWSSDGAVLLGTVGVAGFVEVRELLSEGDGAPGRTWTSTGGLASHPAPAPDGQLFHLVWDNDGPDLHLATSEPTVHAQPPDSDLPVVRPGSRPAPPPPERAEVEGRAYGAGPLSVAPVVGGGFSGRQGQLEAGVRLGDILGRHEHLLIGAYGSDGGARGGLVSSAWGLEPVQVRGEAFAVRVAFGREVRAGGLVGISTERRGRPTRLDLDVGLLVDVPLPGDLDGDRQLGYLELDIGQIDDRRARWGIAGIVRAQAGQTAGDTWARGEAGGAVRLGRQVGVVGEYTYGLTNARSELDRYRLGGVATSVAPGPWLWSRVTDGAFPVGAWSGSARDQAKVALRAGAGEVYGVRHRLGDDGLAEAGASAVGVGVRSDLRRDPFLGTAALSLRAGIACRIEDPFSGWAPRPCHSLDDYAAWGSVIVKR
ncbi:MAG: hypothetical protein ACI9K2_004628 [Myxococcota bacterium]|jgi:hypothetical protein